MSYTRIANYSAEHRVVTDLSYIASLTSITSAVAKTGTYSYAMGPAKGCFGKGLDVALSAYRIGFWLYLGSNDINDVTYLSFFSNGLTATQSVAHIAIQVSNTTGLMRVRRPLDAGSDEILASVATPSRFSTINTWFHVGITHKIDAAVGFLSCYIDGVRVLNLTGDTRLTAYSSGDQQFYDYASYILGAGAASVFAAPGFAEARIDDMFIDSATAEEPDEPVPARRFLPSFPTAAGHDATWTPFVSTNVSQVDDNPNDGDTTYNKALSADLRDTFVFSDITLPADHRIVAVLPYVFAKRLDSELSNEVSVHAWDGLQYEDSADLPLTMSYDVPVFGRFIAQPDETDWNETDFNAMQFGYRSRGSF